MSELGIHSKLLARLETEIHKSHGMLLTTGPTGSGKTTTLYSFLREIHSPEIKIITIEDPVEYHLDGIVQTQVEGDKYTFSEGLKSIVRQDPDIIMVGEIRDLETAQMAVQASLTGHLVLSTVHTNSAAGTITRLLDMGVENYLLASTVTGILAQRLVRRLCRQCSAPAEASPLLLESLGKRQADLSGLRRRVGCRACRSTGYLGRTTISELLVMSEAVRQRVLETSPETAIEAAAVKSGMVGMFEDGIGKALRGETTIDEVLRVTRMS